MMEDAKARRGSARSTSVGASPSGAGCCGPVVTLVLVLIGATFLYYAYEFGLRGQLADCLQAMNMRGAAKGAAVIKHESTSSSKIGLPIIISTKPRGDTRLYQYMTLANGIEIVNIQDENSTAASVAVSVKVGSYYDPPELPGLAHFCEHMLFLGTRNFPAADGFDKFVRLNGGAANAWTDTELSVYYGHFKAAMLFEGIDRLADFMRAPLFNRALVDKEVNAINSEFLKNVQDPAHRVSEVLSHLANHDSPLSQFHTGNIATLSQIPKKNGIDVVERLNEFFEAYYCPDRIRVATYGPQSLAEQFSRASANFSGVSRNSSQCEKSPRTFERPDPWPTNLTNKYVTILGTTPASHLQLFFPLAFAPEDDLSGPRSYISYVFNWKGANGLRHTLQSKLGLVTEISMFFTSSTAGNSMSIYADLTDRGRENLHLVMTYIVGYLNLLRTRGVDLRVFMSMALANNLMWDWPEKGDPDRIVQTMARSMHQIPAPQLLSAGRRIDVDDHNHVDTIMDRATSENVIVLVSEPSDMDKASEASFAFPPRNQTVETLEFYDVKYTVEDLSTGLPETHKLWSDWHDGHFNEIRFRKTVADIIKAANIVHTGDTFPVFPPDFAEYIPNDIDLTYMTASIPKNATSASEKYGDPPTAVDLEFAETSNAQSSEALLAVDRPHESSTMNIVQSKLWYRQGWVSTSPTSHVRVGYRLVLPDEDWESNASLSIRVKLYSTLLTDYISPRLSGYENIGGSFTIEVQPHFVFLSVTGFPSSVRQLSSRLVDLINHVNMHDTNSNLEDHFERVRRNAESELTSHTAMPIEYAAGDLDTVMQWGAFSQAELLAALQANVTFESVHGMWRELTAPKRQIVSMAFGNIAQKEAESLVHNISKRIAFSSQNSASSLNSEFVNVVPKVLRIQGPIEIRKENPRPGDTNDVVVVRIMYGVSTVRGSVLLSLLGSVLEEESFTTLRTNHQLGYIVGSAILKISNVLFIEIYVQGSRHSADHVEALIELVLSDDMPAKLESMTLENYDRLKDALRQRLLDEPRSVADEINRWWEPVSKNGSCMDYKNAQLAAIDSESTSLQAAKDLWKNLVTAPTGGVRNKITIKYFANATKVPTAEDIDRLSKAVNLSMAASELRSREFEHVLFLTASDSKTRANLVERDGWYPDDLHCGDDDDEQEYASKLGFTDGENGTNSSSARTGKENQSDILADNTGGNTESNTTDATRTDGTVAPTLSRHASSSAYAAGSAPSADKRVMTIAPHLLRGGYSAFVQIGGPNRNTSIAHRAARSHSTAAIVGVSPSVDGNSAYEMDGHDMAWTVDIGG
eukprot:TRINITY_DN3136_c1_g5_i1.p1 TRINITY_DN3136_c1_g5~~TRINITY_DN3136_c1_g5_i1.p1  ORF type:complete len:1317 (-),score=194.57 TRINITY_DN3136_c1_g5_i1:99-4049(-)